MRINFELLDLRAFICVLDLGGFHKAAETLNMSQSALSRRIRSLEDAVGAPLLERTTRKVGPTTVGRSFAPLARRLLDELENALLETPGVGKRLTDQITIACIPTAAFQLLPRAIERFKEQYPLIRFRILDKSSQEGLESVRRGEAEFGINLTGGSDPEFNFTPMMEDPLVLICPKTHRLARKSRITWKDLQNEALIGVSRASGNRLILENALAKTAIRLNFQYEVDHLSTVLGLVERGLGLAVLPKLAAPRDAYSIIVSKSISDPPVNRTIGLVERRTARLAPAALRFRDMLLKL